MARNRPLPPNRDRLHYDKLMAMDGGGYPLIFDDRWFPEKVVRWNDKANFTEDACVQFFLDDYRFEGAWTHPARAAERLSGTAGATTPDFSLWPDMPIPMQMWQVYRRQWMGAYFQQQGFKVVPTVGWTHPVQPWHFAGIPKHSYVALSTQGCNREYEKRRFRVGWYAMLEALEPDGVLCIGDLTSIVQDVDVEIRQFDSFTAGKRKELAGIWVGEEPPQVAAEEVAEALLPQREKVAVERTVRVQRSITLSKETV